LKSRSIPLVFYGDDFTGTMSTAEVLAGNGVSTVVFTSVPSRPALQRRFPDIRALGIAGSTRTLPVERLREELVRVLGAIREYDPRVVLYKVCSTFDSSGEIGSIGKAIEIGREILSAEIVPILPAAPGFGRYTVFGHHFARLGEQGVYRLDRHPSVSHHPTTPMTEADLRLHLRDQTELPIGLVDVLDIGRGVRWIQRQVRRLLREGVFVVLFDCLTRRDLEQVCTAVLTMPEARRPVYFVGSHEIPHGLVSAMGELAPASGNASTKPRSIERGSPRSQRKPILIVSGSCATVTGEQIQWAKDNGYVDIAVRTDRLLDPNQRKGETVRVVEQALSGLRQGKPTVVHAAIGPQDERIQMVRVAARQLSLPMERVNESIGGALGTIAGELVRRSGLKRLVVAGGDTSGMVQKSLGIEALRIRASFAVPAPLCLAYCGSREFSGLEIAFKGGQVGAIDYFQSVQEVGPADE
jgi:uncharacterized protein YgbK (DUF1537 family)